MRSLDAAVRRGCVDVGSMEAVLLHAPADHLRHHLAHLGHRGVGQVRQMTSLSFRQFQLLVQVEWDVRVAVA